MTYDDKTEITISQMRAVWDEAGELARRKNAKYKDSWREQGWRGNLSRVLDKATRVRTMLWRTDPDYGVGTDESARETALDMLNTLTFFIVNLDSNVEWGHEPKFLSTKIEINGSAMNLPPIPSWSADEDEETYRQRHDTEPRNDETTAIKQEFAKDERH